MFDFRVSNLENLCNNRGESLQGLGRDVMRINDGAYSDCRKTGELSVQQKGCGEAAENVENAGGLVLADEGS